MRYKGRNKEKQQLALKQNFKNYQSSDCRLKLVYVKSESLVIVNHNVTVNDISNFAHTAHHARRVVSAGNLIMFSALRSLTLFVGVSSMLKVSLVLMRGRLVSNGRCRNLSEVDTR